MTSETEIRIGDKFVNLNDAFPLDLGFIEDAIENGVDLTKAEKGIPPGSAVKLIKMVLKRCGVSEDEARRLSMDQLGVITKFIDDKMKTEAEVRPT